MDVLSREFGTVGTCCLIEVVFLCFGKLAAVSDNNTEVYLEFCPEGGFLWFFF